jgi:hypothetical protein
MISIIKEFPIVWYCVFLIFLQAAIIHRVVCDIAKKQDTPSTRDGHMHKLITQYGTLMSVFCPFLYVCRGALLMTAFSKNYGILVATYHGTTMGRDLFILLIVWGLHTTMFEDFSHDFFRGPLRREMLQGCFRCCIMSRGMQVLVTSNLLNGNNPPTTYQEYSWMWGAHNPYNNHVAPRDVIALVVLLLMSWWFQNAMFRVMNPVALVVAWVKDMLDGENFSKKVYTFSKMWGGTLFSIVCVQFTDSLSHSSSTGNGMPKMLLDVAMSTMGLL